MRAVVLDALGDPAAPGTLRLDASAPAPPIEKASIRVRVLAASINFPDALQIKAR